MRRTAHALDAVTLLRSVSGRPAGTVVEDDPKTGRALVEVVNKDRLFGLLPADDFLDDLIEVPYARLQVLDAVRHP